MTRQSGYTAKVAGSTSCQWLSHKVQKDLGCPEDGDGVIPVFMFKVAKLKMEAVATV